MSKYPNFVNWFFETSTDSKFKKGDSIETPKDNFMPVTSFLTPIDSENKGIYRVKFRVRSSKQPVLIGVTTGLINDFVEEAGSAVSGRGLDRLEGCWCLNLLNGSKYIHTGASFYMNQPLKTVEMVELELNTTLGTLGFIVNYDDKGTFQDVALIDS